MWFIYIWKQRKCGGIHKICTYSSQDILIQALALWSRYEMPPLNKNLVWTEWWTLMFDKVWEFRLCWPSFSNTFLLLILMIFTINAFPLGNFGWAIIKDENCFQWTSCSLCTMLVSLNKIILGRKFLSPQNQESHCVLLISPRTAMLEIY